jgi:hypothetical protein
MNPPRLTFGPACSSFLIARRSGRFVNGGSLGIAGFAARRQVRFRHSGIVFGALSVWESHCAALNPEVRAVQAVIAE